MKLQITVMKAPWPKGAKVGDVVEADRIPGWALGKCVQVADDVEATVAFDESDAAAEHPDVARMREEAKHAAAAAASMLEQAREEHAAELRKVTHDHQAELADLQSRIDAATAGAGAKVQELLDANADLSKKLAEAQAALAAAQKKR